MKLEVGTKEPPMVVYFDLVDIVAVIEKKEGNTLTIEGVFVSNEKKHLQLKKKSNACILCETGLDVKHTVSSLVI